MGIKCDMTEGATRLGGGKRKVMGIKCDMTEGATRLVGGGKER